MSSNSHSLHDIGFFASLTVRYMNSKQRQRFIVWWQSRQTQGKLHYILISGVLGFGLSSGIVYLVGRRVCEALIYHTSLTENVSRLFTKDSLMEVLIMMSLYLIAGFFWGIARWRRNEKVYRFLEQETH